MASRLSARRKRSSKRNHPASSLLRQGRSSQSGRRQSTLVESKIRQNMSHTPRSAPIRRRWSMSRRRVRMIRSSGNSIIHGSLLLRDDESMVYFHFSPLALDFICYREAEKKRNRLRCGTPAINHGTAGSLNQCVDWVSKSHAGPFVSPKDTDIWGRQDRAHK